MIPIYLIIVVIILISDTNGEPESTHSNHRESNHREDNNQHSTASDYWRNHKFNLNSLYAKYREGKSNNEPIFSEPSDQIDYKRVDGYETMPNTIQITAIPGGAGGFNAFPTQFQGGFNNFGGTPGFGGFGGLGGLGGLGNLGGWHGGWNNYHQRPIFYITKKSDWFSWLIPLLLLLGAPLLLGALLIPVALKSIIFFLQICRNLGILLPLIPALTGQIQNPVNPLVPAAG